MIPVALMFFFGFLVLGVTLLVFARSVSLDYEETRARVLQPDAETLVYDVADGQDPADVIVALTRAGYTAIEDATAGRVLVHCPRGRTGDRPDVRLVLEQVCASGAFSSRAGSDPVTFTDEG